MKRLFIIPVNILILALLIALSLSCSNSSPASSPTSVMEEYLLRNYDHSINLILENPNASPEVYWLYSDNFIASIALEDNYLDISATIKESIDSYQISTQDKYQVLEGTIIDTNLFTYGPDSIDIQANETRIVKIEKADPNIIMSDWQEYADRLLLAAMNYTNSDEYEQALQLFNKASDIYDGIGFTDKAFNIDGYYSTYKLALYLIAANRLDITLQERDSIVNTILWLQDTDTASNRYGGIYTDYTADRKPRSTCDTNTETTSLCLIALSEQ